MKSPLTQPLLVVLLLCVGLPLSGAAQDAPLAAPPLVAAATTFGVTPRGGLMGGFVGRF